MSIVIFGKHFVKYIIIWTYHFVSKILKCAFRARQIHDVTVARLTRELYEGHAPHDAPDPTDDDDEGEHLKQGGDEIESEGPQTTATARLTATARAEGRDECACNVTRTHIETRTM